MSHQVVSVGILLVVQCRFCLLGSARSDGSRNEASGDFSPRHSSLGEVTPTCGSPSLTNSKAWFPCIPMMITRFVSRCAVVVTGDDDVLSVGDGSGLATPQDGEESMWEGGDCEFSVPSSTVKGPKQSELELRCLVFNTQYMMMSWKTPLQGYLAAHFQSMMLWASKRLLIN